MWDKADLHAGKDILRTDVGRGINGSNTSRCGLHPPFQAQVLHSILDVHILGQIANRLGDELRQTKSTSEDNIDPSLNVHVPLRLVIDRSSPTSSLVRGLSASYVSRNSEPRGSFNDELCLNEAEMTVFLGQSAPQM